MPLVGLSKEDYVNYIKLELGAPIVRVEICERIPDIVDAAFNELKHYITDVETMTVPYSNKIDLTGKKVANVVYVMRGNTNNSLGGLQSVMYVYSTYGILNNVSISDFSRILLANQNKNALATDLDFHYDKREEQLYVYANQIVPATVTLVYTPIYETVEDIIEPYWQNLLKRLSLAMSKEILSRIRGKYNLNSATYNLDADRLASEAQAELSEIREYLISNSDTLMPLD